MSITKKARYYFLLALLLHFLLFTSVTVHFLIPPPPYESSADSDSDHVLPAYVYHEEKYSPNPDTQTADASTPAPTSATPNTQKAEQPHPDTANGKVEQQDTTSDDVIALKKEDTAQTTQNTPDNTKAAPNKTASQKGSKKSHAQQNINQDIAAKKGMENLLLKLLSQATAAKLVYPKIAEDFALRGTAKVKFLLYPDGRVTNVTLVESSGSNILDDTALQTIRAISPVQGVNQYIQAPKVIHAGIIFGNQQTRQFETFS